MRQPRSSRRARSLPPLQLAELMAQARRSGALDIAIGTPPGAPPSAAVEHAVRAMWSGHNQYGDAAGMPALRKVVADRASRRAGEPVDPETEVTITCGATEGLLIALLAFTDPHDEVIVVEPAFEIYAGSVRVCGAIPVPLPLDGPDWRLDLDRVRAAITPRTRAIIVNSPHNPTGRVFDRNEVQGLVALCHAQRLLCVFDEVYDAFVFGGTGGCSPLNCVDGPATSVVVGSLSKSDQMSGWRIGYTIAPPETTRVLRAVHERTTFGTSVPLQLGAAALAEPTYGASDFADARDMVVNRLRTMGFQVSAPQGGWFVFAGTGPLGWASDELATALVRDAGVLVAPGTAFFTDPARGRPWIRVTFVKDPVTTVEALDRLERFLSVSTAS